MKLKKLVRNLAVVSALSAAAHSVSAAQGVEVEQVEFYGTVIYTQPTVVVFTPPPPPPVVICYPYRGCW